MLAKYVRIVSRRIVRTVLRTDIRRDQEGILSELHTFTGLSENSILEMLTKGDVLVANDWNRINPQNSDEMLEFYSTSRFYLYDLARYDYFNEDNYLARRLVAQMANGRVLDYGGGIGDMLIHCWREGARKLTYYDVRGYTSKFAEWRFSSRGMNVKFIYALGSSDELEGEYDNIFCFDVLEHVLDPISHAERLSSHLCDGGKLFVLAPFGHTDRHPMHLDSNLSTSEILSSANLRFIRSFWRKSLEVWQN